MVNWFCYYGIPKRYWKIYLLNFELIKQYGVSNENKTNLANWGI